MILQSKNFYNQSCNIWYRAGHSTLLLRSKSIQISGIVWELPCFPLRLIMCVRTVFFSEYRSAPEPKVKSYQIVWLWNGTNAKLLKLLWDTLKWKSLQTQRLNMQRVHLHAHIKQLIIHSQWKQCMSFGILWWALELWWRAKMGRGII